MSIQQAEDLKHESALKRARRAELVAKVRARVAERLPKRIIAERTGASSDLIDSVRREMGVRLPPFAEWVEE